MTACSIVALDVHATRGVATLYLVERYATQFLLGGRGGEGRIGRKKAYRGKIRRGEGNMEVEKGIKKLQTGEKGKSVPRKNKTARMLFSGDGGYGSGPL